MQSLVEQFKSRIAIIDSPMTASEVVPQQTPKVVKLYNIFKRSLPVNHNKLAFQNVTEEDVNFLFRNILRPKVKNDETVIYWDAIEVGSTDGWNVFSNEGIDTTNIRDGQNINTYRERLHVESNERPDPFID